MNTLSRIFTMKKLILILLCIVLASEIDAQNTMAGKAQINAGFGMSQYGLPVYVGLDVGIHPDISIGVEGSYQRHTIPNYNAALFGIEGNINYHFNSVFKIKNEHWDVYAGATVGYWIWNWNNSYNGSLSSGLGLSGQIGARYFIVPRWAINFEISGGTLSGGKFGLTHRF
jgi:outer membrane immunogenic protein